VVHVAVQKKGCDEGDRERLRGPKARCSPIQRSDSEGENSSTAKASTFATIRVSVAGESVSAPGFVPTGSMVTSVYRTYYRGNAADYQQNDEWQDFLFLCGMLYYAGRKS